MPSTRYTCMASKLFRGGALFFPFLFSFLLCSTSGSAQKLEKYYTSSTQGDYVLYFLLPSKPYKSDQANCKFQYDLTYASNTDSVVMNFSFWNDTLSQVSHIRLENMNEKQEVQKIYVDKDKSSWLIRLSAKFPKQIMEAYFESERGAVEIWTGDRSYDLS